MAENETDPLIKINELLKEVKNRLNETGDKGKKYTLHIEDKYDEKDVVNDPTEDIELKIRSLWLSRK